MARVRLYFLDQDQQDVIDTAGAITRLPFLRMTALLRIGNLRMVTDGLFDSGTVLTVFPESVWKRCEGSIEWLSFPAGEEPAAWWTTASGLTGGSFPVRLGRIHVAVLDTDGNELPSVPVYAKFTQDQGKMPRKILLGLAYGILQGRRVSFDVDQREAWLEDR